MPRGYYGDCRDCYFYNSYFHKVNNDEYEYKCDKCNKYFNDCYGETCHLFEDIADIKEEKRKNEKRKEEILGGIIILGGILDEDEDDSNDASTNQNTTDPQPDNSLFNLLFFLACLVAAICDIYNWYYYK